MTHSQCFERHLADAPGGRKLFKTAATGVRWRSQWLLLNRNQSHGLTPTSLLRQIDADQFFVVADVHVLVGESRSTPDHFAAERVVRRLDHVHP